MAPCPISEIECRTNNGGKEIQSPLIGSQLHCPRVVSLSLQHTGHHLLAGATGFASASETHAKPHSKRATFFVSNRKTLAEPVAPWGSRRIFC